MSYTIEITETWEESPTDGDTSGPTLSTTRHLYKQTVDQLDLTAVLKAVNGMGRKTAKRRGRGAQEPAK